MREERGRKRKKDYMVQCKEHPGNEDTFSPRTVLVCNLTSRGHLYSMDTFLCPIGVPMLSLIMQCYEPTSSYTNGLSHMEEFF